MKKVNFYFLMGLILAGLSLSLEGASHETTDPKNALTTKNPSFNRDNSSEIEEKFNLMERDENENSDTLAIPLDDSEVEDEEEINAAEKKNVFDLPQSQKK